MHPFFRLLYVVLYSTDQGVNNCRIEEVWLRLLAKSNMQGRTPWVLCEKGLRLATYIEEIQVSGLISNRRVI